MPSRRSSPSVRLRRLAAQLRELREGAGLTQEDVSERTGKDRSTLYRLENAQQRPQKSTLIQLLDLYGVAEPRRGELLMLLREAGQRGWMQPYRSELPEVYSDYISFEDEARSISNYESLFVPGLLQTEAYARAQLRGTLPTASDDEIENRVAARLERQPVLLKDDAPKLWAIMDEAALRRLVGGRDVMRGQVERLLEARSLPGVTIQVIPYGAGAHPGMDGAFVILEFPDADDTSIVYVESAAGGLFLEEDAEFRRYILMFEHLRAAASGLDATAALLEAIVSEILPGRRCGMISPDLSRAEWRRSKHSGSNGNCVEVGGGGPAVLVRDTKDRAGAVLAFAPDAWRRFAAMVKDAGKA